MAVRPGSFTFAGMELEILPFDAASQPSHGFKAEHPMFKYDVPEVPATLQKRLKEFENFVVVGMGGSVLPLKVFTDAAALQKNIFYLDTVDSLRVKEALSLSNALFCFVSKSGDTLEVRAVISEVLRVAPKTSFLVVTNSEKGQLRKWANEQSLLSLEIPKELGGRFTNFSVFHRALLERFGVNFQAMARKAVSVRDGLQKDSSVLYSLTRQLFDAPKSGLILWAYGERLKGLAYWAQQALGESLGKISRQKKRVGLLPTVLLGPQDQHSVLQLLMEGPQDKVLWFLESKPKNSTGSATLLPEAFQDLSNKSLGDVLNILSESTYQTFKERLSSPETAQPISRWVLSETMEDVVEVIVVLQALVEFAAEYLQIDAFNQPGVERGKQIARELIRSR